MNTVVSVASLASASAVASPSIAADISDPIFGVIERFYAAWKFADQSGNDEGMAQLNEAERQLENVRPATIGGAAALLTCLLWREEQFQKLEAPAERGFDNLLASLHQLSGNKFVSRPAAIANARWLVPLGDPIFAAIEAVREAHRKFEVAVSEQSRLEEESQFATLKELHKSPAWRASARRWKTSRKGMMDAEAALAAATPTTLAGAAALSDHLEWQVTQDGGSWEDSSDGALQSLRRALSRYATATAA